MHHYSNVPFIFFLTFLSIFFILYLSGWICRFFFLHSVYYNPLPSLFNAQLSLTSQCLNCSIAGNSDLFKLASVSFWFIILWSLPYFLPKPGVPDSSCIFLVPTLGSSISPDGPVSFIFCIPYLFCIQYKYFEFNYFAYLILDRKSVV